MEKTGRSGLWNKLIGDTEQFSLEARIFNATCVVCCITLLINVPFNILIDLPGISLFMFVLFVLVGIIYYRARFQNKLSSGVIIFNALTLILLIINYKINSGIDGPTSIVFILSCFLCITIIPRKQVLFWIVLNIITVMALLVGQYVLPGNITNSYTTVMNRYVDIGYTYILTIVLICWITIYIRDSYHKEKIMVETKSKELERNNKAKDKLFSILAHDLRSPLSSIQNFLEILTELDLEEHETRSIKKSLLNETKNTMQMLSNMLAWSKAQMEGVSAKLAKISPAETLELTLQIQQTVASEKRIRLNTDIDPSICVLADPDMLQMIIRNLVNNAIKFTSSGGEINITTVTEDQLCTIMISDNGIGIPYEDQKEMFSLNARSTFGTQKEKGMGLGLILCKEFTELQNGKIWFKSTPGEGTTFYVSLEFCGYRNLPDPQFKGKNVSIK